MFPSPAQHGKLLGKPGFSNRAKLGPHSNGKRNPESPSIILKGDRWCKQRGTPLHGALSGRRDGVAQTTKPDAPLLANTQHLHV